jgi:Polysaccharide lyase
LLFLVLGGVVLVSLSPWASDSIIPGLRVSPGHESALGDAMMVAPPPAQTARAAGVGAPSVGRSTFVAAAPSSPPAPAPRGGRAQEQGISPGVPVQSREANLHPHPHPHPASPPTPSPAPVVPPPAQPVATPTQPASEPVAAPHLVANFENGLQGWSTSVIDDVDPTVESGIVRDGENASVIRLSGDQSSSQLILGGDGGSSGAGVVQIHEGDEYAFAFSLYIETMVYGVPGADNLIMRLKSDASDAPVFGLQLWDLPGYPWEVSQRGLWSSGEAVGGDRFLAAVPERVWHDVAIRFKASSQEAGFYEVYLDGQLVDARDAVSLISPDSSYAQIEVGLFRDGDRVQGDSEIHLDAAKLGDTLESVLP